MIPRRLADLVPDSLEAFARDLHVAMPATVRSYDQSARTAELELGVRAVLPPEDEEDEPDVSEDYPILQAVPVAWPQAGGFFLHFPLTAGDTGLVVFAEADIGAWRATGQPGDPDVPVRHGLSGGVFFPGLLTQAGSGGANGAQIGSLSGAKITFGSTIDVGGAVALAEAPDVKTHLQAISTALASIATAAGTSSSYVYATVIGSAPIDTTIVRGT